MISIVFCPHLSKTLGQRRGLTKKRIPFEDDALQLTVVTIGPGHSRRVEKKITTCEDISTIDELGKTVLCSIVHQ